MGRHHVYPTRKVTWRFLLSVQEDRLRLLNEVLQVLCATLGFGRNAQRRVGPQRATKVALVTAVDVTPLFSLRENAITKEPGLSYPESWRCVSRLGCFGGGSDSSESSPYVTLSRGAFSAPSLVTPIR